MVHTTKLQQIRRKLIEPIDYTRNNVAIQSQQYRSNSGSRQKRRREIARSLTGLVLTRVPKLTGHRDVWSRGMDASVYRGRQTRRCRLTGWRAQSLGRTPNYKTDRVAGLPARNTGRAAGSQADKRLRKGGYAGRVAGNNF